MAFSCFAQGPSWLHLLCQRFTTSRHLSWVTPSKVLSAGLRAVLKSVRMGSADFRRQCCASQSTFQNRPIPSYQVSAWQKVSALGLSYLHLYICFQRKVSHDFVQPISQLCISLYPVWLFPPSSLCPTFPLGICISILQPAA